MLPVVWLPEANAELTEALAYYEGIRPELGLRFTTAVVDAVEAMATSPLRFALVDKERRRIGVRRFPYGLFFSHRRNSHRRNSLFARKTKSQALAIAPVGLAS